jgi:uncharacterized protein YrzB (UPF0473 family)
MEKKELLENQLTFIDEEGNEILCQILFTFHSDDFKKDYVLFYPVGQEESEEQIDVMAASYTAEEENGSLSPVETDEEWEMIEDMLEKFEDNMEEHVHDHDHEHHHHHHHEEGHECCGGHGEECECEDDEDCEEDEEGCCCKNK